MSILKIILSDHHLLSDTVIIISEYTCLSSNVGVQFSVQFSVLKLDHCGWFCIEKVIGSQSGSCAVGVNVYGSHSCQESFGVHDIVGGLFISCTVILKDSKLTESYQSLTDIVIQKSVHASSYQGVQLSSQLLSLKLDHGGLFCIEKYNLSQNSISLSEVVGINV